jgi:D-tyrosyl-tRNA(Tyr) deacylase
MTTKTATEIIMDRIIRARTFESFKKYRVEADSVEDFLKKYYKASRYTEQGEQYAASLLESYKADFESDGFVFVSRHDSRSGEVVSFYGATDEQ